MTIRKFQAKILWNLSDTINLSVSDLSARGGSAVKKTSHLNFIEVLGCFLRKNSVSCNANNGSGSWIFSSVKG